jgi:Repeat of unknown function (DUF5907)
MDKSLIAALLLFPCVALGQTHTLPGNNVVPSGATFTLQSGSTTDFNSGSTVDFTGATVTGLGAGSGTVTSFSAGTLSPIFTTSVATATTTPALTFSLSTAGAHTFLGNETGSTAAPHYVQPAFTDLSGTATDAQTPDSLTLTAIPNLTGNGFVKTSGGVGTLSVDTSTYLTGNQSITLSGEVTGTGTTAITTAIPASTVTYAKIQNVSANSKLLGSSATGAGAPPSEITLGTNLSMSGSTLNATGGGGGTPGGSTTQVQYNNAGAFGGIANATSDGTTMTLTSPNIVTAIDDSNSNPILAFSATGSAVNYISLANAAAGAPAVIPIGAAGTSTNIDINLVPKGTGSVLIQPGSITDPGIAFNGSPNYGIYFTGGSLINFSSAGTATLSISTSGTRTTSTGRFGWTSSSSSEGTVDAGLNRNAAGVVEVNNGTTGQYRELRARSVIHSGVTVANLPTGVAGMVAYVTDGAASLAWGATVTGGSTTPYLVWYNGSAWTVVGK